ncbi:MAG: hypothetical protein A3H70_03040 [Candidatus Komeilibacteria bacterium RIFCSPLOWO2_02_FULL_48_11]|uniref:Uncharacterized protein n=1 Tax=Candidatus Komeilibacteria bacterium RIFCSPLOWO2_02_FULL_48_11 TaxID=1798553 RepID=A0A1G2BPL4_9BACT|nr:MAG: hypothetical protein A3H70_03040 [Candidatus Komeilibacteria bacterium RIFCSPLOWO2_02_FULL_48_11]
MATAMRLEDAHCLFPLGKGKNPRQAPPTHISQLTDEDRRLAAERLLEVLCNLTGEKAAKVCWPQK